MKLSLSLRVFAPFAIGYLLASVFRPITAVIAPDIVRDLGIDATTLGLLASAFFVAAAASQLPLGILLDRYGPRLVNGVLLLATALGALLFAVGDGVVLIALGRALIGIGVASCMASSLKAFTLWFPPERMPLVNGLALAAGGTGMVAGTLPVEMALQYTDWRGVHFAAAGFVLFAAILVFAIVPRRDLETNGETFAVQLKGLATILSSLKFWRVAPIVMVSMGAYAGVLHLWAGPWLRDVAGYDRTQVASTLLIAAAAMIIAFPLGGFLSTRLQRFGVSAMTFVVCCMTTFMFVQAALLVELGTATNLAWLLFGVFGTLSLLVYAPLNQTFPKEMAGRVSTSMTLFWMAGAFVVQTGFGAVLDRFPVSASGEYSPHGYQMAFAILISAQIAALGWYFVAGRTRKNQAAALQST